MKKYIIILLILIMLFSVSNLYMIGGDYYIKEIIWFVVGFGCIYFISKINTNYIEDKSIYLYVLGNILLLVTLLFGSSINGAKIWLKIGSISLQVSEFMKIFLILYLREFSKKNISDLKYFLISFIIVLIPSILTFLEPDTGAVIVYFMIYLVFLVLRRLNKFYYIVPLGLIIILGGVFLGLYYGNQDLFIKIFGTSFFYRMDRITLFFKGEGYQIGEALKSISNSGLFGIRDKVYFPEGATDFAFTSLIANIGIIGAGIFLFVYNLLFVLICNLKVDKNILLPVVIIILFEYVVNVLMNVGLFPIMGITLPFLSYGGSSLVSMMILIGFLLKEKSIE